MTIMDTSRKLPSGGTLFFTFLLTLPAGRVLAGDDDWQLRRLMQPTEQELARERSGRIFIYDGLHEKQVHRAMDQQFDRVGAMMFVRTRVETVAGDTEVEEDGCDDD